LRGLGMPKTVADWSFQLPFTNWAGFLNNFTQPLSWTPEPNTPPDPTQSNGGDDSNGSNGGQPQGNGNNNGNQDNNGSNNGPNNGSNNSSDNNPDNNSGPNPGNTSSNKPGHQTVNSNPVRVQLNLCDPPGNVFGVANGVVLSSTPTSLTIGRGTGNGTVCLLLRPYVDIAALGLGTGNYGVNSGNASYNMLGKSEPGHVIIYARYSAPFVPLIPRGPQPPSTITAILDYGGVGPFCSDLMHTMGKGPPFSPNPVNWLSGASLENRLCITSMVGSQITVHAWVMDAAQPGPTTHTTAVDPQLFLYNDAWGHM